MIKIIEGECVREMDKMQRKSFDMIIADPPFGIDYDGKTANHNRKKSLVMDGYEDVPPKEYEEFSSNWMWQASNVLRDSGSMWVFSSWNSLEKVLRSLDRTDFEIVNHIIWEYNFPIYTSRKFTNSHYHLLYCCKKGHSKMRTYNRDCRFADDDVDDTKHKLQYADRSDVWRIPKTYLKGEVKVATRLPDELVRKIFQYSTNKGFSVLDPFAGSGTSGKIGKELECDVTLIDQNPECIAYMKGRGL